MVTATRTRTEEEKPTYSYGRQRSFIDEDNDEEDNYGKVNYFSSSPYTAVKEDEDDEPAFEIQQRYNTDDEDEDENETDVYKKNGYVLSRNGLLEVNRENSSAEYDVAKKVKLTPRMKIALCCYSLIVALLIGFAIYNVVAINNASSMIASSQIEIASKQDVINGLEEEYNALGTSETIKSKLSSDYVELNGTNSVVVESPVLDEIEVFDAPSNWFDSICEFFSSLF
ncbi:MAG: hypothetical protein IJS68_02100 [Clostridia bacterium]|nr:hypothetical protein [Clostridia bacterium]